MRYFQGVMADHLKEASLMTMDNNKCVDYFIDYVVAVGDALMCTSSKTGKKPGFGDNGSPLVHHGQAIGIVSFGGWWIQSPLPGLFTRLSHYHDWIISIASWQK